MSSMSFGPATLGSPDPFWRGWRVIEEVQRDGRLVEREVPLTEDDLLHPLEGDVIVQNDPHHRDVMYLYYVFDRITSEQPEVLVLGDHRVDWGVTGIRPHCPDVVVFDHAPQWDRALIQTFPARPLAARPRLVVEVTSASTRNNDLERKREQYYQIGIPYYLIVDRMAGDDRQQVELIGLRRGPKDWRVARPNEQGRLLLPTLDVWVGVEDNRVVCYDADGEPFPVYSEALQRITEEVEARREAIAALEATEQTLATTEQTLATTEAQLQQTRRRAKRERQRRQQAEEENEEIRRQMAALQAEVERLRQGGATS